MKKRLTAIATPLLGLMLTVSAFGAPTIIRSGGNNLEINQDLGSSGIDPQFQFNTGLNGSVLLNTNLPSLNAASKSVSNNIEPNPAWARFDLNNNNMANQTATSTTAGWVSYATTQNGEANGVVPNGNWVDYYHLFNIEGAGQLVSAQLLIAADDRADVSIRNIGSNTEKLIYATPTAGASYPTCINRVIGCQGEYVGVFDSNPSSPFSSLTNFRNFDITGLTGGWTLMRVRVYQEAGTGFGTAYVARFAAVPEPGFYGLLSVGLGGILLAVQRRRKKAEN